ncbi:MAG TPA: acyl-CoA dehydrogenase family protein [Microbacteriaceae bacterium]|nr:acyl-CoA dehydrogenase family protein [Microbacteriaceae bacterium]
MSDTAETTTSAERVKPLLAAAKALAPDFEANSRQAELDRRLPAEVSDKMKAAGLFWMKTPLELGGAELHPLDFADVMEEIAYHDASAAWATMIGNGTTGVMAGWLPDEGVQDLFADKAAPPVTAGQFTPRGKAVPVDGGYRVTGRWAFGSGIDHANWVIGAAVVEGSDDIIFVCAPKSEVTVHDNWNVAGLQGTGSHDYSMEDVFVPAHRSMNAYAGVAKRGGPLFKEGVLIFISNEISPLVVGVARRAIDDMIDLAQSTTRTVGALIDRPAFHKAIGQAEAKWHAARALYRGALAEGFEIAETVGSVDPDTASKLWARHAFTGELCADLVREIFRYGGGRVLSLDHPMQRHLRNLLATLQHIHMTEEKFEFAGLAAIQARAAR